MSVANKKKTNANIDVPDEYKSLLPERKQKQKKKDVVDNKEVEKEARFVERLIRKKNKSSDSDSDVGDSDVEEERGNESEREDEESELEEDEVNERDEEASERGEDEASERGEDEASERGEDEESSSEDEEKYEKPVIDQDMSEKIRLSNKILAIIHKSIEPVFIRHERMELDRIEQETSSRKERLRMANQPDNEVYKKPVLSYEKKQELLMDVLREVNIEVDLRLFEMFFNDEIVENIISFMLSNVNNADIELVEKYIYKHSKSFLGTYQCSYVYMKIVAQREIDEWNKVLYEFTQLLPQFNSSQHKAEFVNSQNEYMIRVLDSYIVKLMKEKIDTDAVWKDRFRKKYEWVLNTNLEKAKLEYQRIMKITAKDMAAIKRQYEVYNVFKSSLNPTGTFDESIFMVKSIPIENKISKMIATIKKDKKKSDEKVNPLYKAPKEVVYPKPFFVEKENELNLHRLKDYLNKCKTPGIDVRGAIRGEIRDVDENNNGDLKIVGALLEYIFPLYAKLTVMEINKRGQVVSVKDAIRELDKNIAEYTEGKLKICMDRIKASNLDESFKNKIRILSYKSLGILIDLLFPGFLKQELIELFPNESTENMSIMFPNIFLEEKIGTNAITIRTTKQKGRLVGYEIKNGQKVGGHYEYDNEDQKEEDLDKIKQMQEKLIRELAKLKENMTSEIYSAPIQTRTYLNGRLRREERKKRAYKFYENEHVRVKEDLISISPECVHKTEGVYVRLSDDTTPESSLVHVNKASLDQQNFKYYLAKNLMRKALCEHSEIRDDSVLVDNNVYLCARLDKTGILNPFTSFQYSSLKSTRNIEGDFPLRILLDKSEESNFILGRIYAQIEMDVNNPTVFNHCINELERNPALLNIYQVLIIFYVLVAFKTPYFQLNHPSLRERVESLYIDKSFISNNMVNMIKSTNLFDIKDIVGLMFTIRDSDIMEYIEMFVKHMIHKEFPYILLPKEAFPYLSSSFTFERILPLFEEPEVLSDDEDNSPMFGLSMKKAKCTVCKKKTVVLPTIRLPKAKKMWVCEKCVNQVIHK